jgi:L,D-transpeptidase catalytic domain
MDAMIGWATRLVGFAAAASAGALLALPGTAAAQSGTTSNPGAAPPPGAPTGPINGASPDVILSNETTFTTWTTADYVQPVHTRPSKRSPTITRTRFVTSDGFLQSYIVLRLRHTPRGDWALIRLPMRPNGRTGWVRREALDSFNLIHTQLVLDRAKHTLTLYRNGNEVMTVPVGVGKPSTPTPPGHFWITEKFAVHGQTIYGPYAMGTSDYSTLTDWHGGGIVGLHGTNEPQLVPGNPSHGCIRLHNADVLRLKSLVSIGTPLSIL